MARRSSIQELPKEVQAEVNRLIGEGHTIADVIAHLGTLGHDVSKSAVGRHRQRITRMAERVRQSHEITQAIVAELGQDATEGRTGRALVVATHTLVHDVIDKLVEGKDVSPQDLMFIGRALKDLAGANKLSVDEELRIEQRTKAKAADAAEKVARTAGLSAEMIGKFRAGILGIQGPAGGRDAA